LLPDNIYILLTLPLAFVQVVDNVCRNGHVGDPSYSDGAVEGVRDLLRAISDDKEVDTTTIGTAGEKGYDGFLYAVRL
jgi:predicted O-methyltransferase YrrM